ncbi:uncharacterized protein G2W53_023909 [Senna tora]|uniref:Uncharacterized protein n=1 Tax=Senna tora TaxID=362788 RepID=A0A834TBE2_9FABA|nr:uncharacterized protein G2W53_023909 [Senna tora]
MNTKTMRLPPRRVLTPSASPNNKRKEKEDSLDRPNPTSITTTKLLKPHKPRTGLQPPRSSAKGSEPSSSNQLLAGYLAHEFLTRGTLLGQPWDPDRSAEGPTANPSEPEKKRAKLSEIREAEPPQKHERYVEVAELFRADGTHLPGMVNPTELARFLNL